MTELKWWERDILKVLREDHAESATYIGRTVWRSSNSRSAFAIATPALKSLEGRGLVRRMDHERPIMWMRTQAGTDLIQSTNI